MPIDPTVGRLLRCAACAELDDKAAEDLRQACRAQQDWNKVVGEAESHGLAPWLRRQAGLARAEIPASARKQLHALCHRHIAASRIRTQALLEILEACSARGIQVLVLKGAVLAHLIYDEPGLRPMSDIDILVPPSQLRAAAGAAAELGYKDAGHTALPDHHHLPTMTRKTGGFGVALEIHHDALTRDNIGSIRTDRLSDPPREVVIDGAAAYTLGHIDTLRHLCRHALEPRKSTKIGSALDIMIYAVRFAGEIDWSRLSRRHPEVINMLKLLGLLVPWPASLDPHVGGLPACTPSGVGVGMLPLSTLRRRRDRAARLLNPSNWWLHAFYNVPPGRSLVFTKTVRHPARVLYWLWRRRGKPSA